MKKDRLTTIILVVVMLAGLSLLLYPTVSDLWNSFHQSQAIAEYSQEVERLDDGIYENMWAEAQRYNEELIKKTDRFRLSQAELEEYESLLNVLDNGILGYIEIPKISCSLPIYHGVDEAILQTAIGHIAGSSLPVGGESTHCVISGHRGLPSAKLFTNLDKLVKGDVFLLKVLNQTLTYEVDQILTVEPEQMEALEIEEGKDYCTLVTCTPYGINSHRLLVRGHRIENLEEGDVRLADDAFLVEPKLVAAVIAVSVLLLLFLIIMTRGRRKKKGKGCNGTER